MVIINSYSSTPTAPRWRVFIPTTVAMPIAAHRAIGEQIMRSVNRAGYWSKKQLEANERIKSRKHHGFDMGKLTPSSLFYLPCQAENPAHSFFIDHNSPDRAPIDPYIWAGYAANHRRPAPEPVATVSPTVVPLEQRPMPVTDCPRLRRMRELLAEEEAAKFRDDRAQRQAAAIDRWRVASSGDGNRSVLPAWASICAVPACRPPRSIRSSDRKLGMPTIRLSAATRSGASSGRLQDHRADWPPDHPRWRRFVRDGEVPVTVIRRDHQPDGEPGINRLDAARQAIRSEAMARERAERSLEEAQVTIHDLQTKLAHERLAKDEALEAAQRAMTGEQSIRQTLQSIQAELVAWRCWRAGTLKAPMYPTGSGRGSSVASAACIKQISSTDSGMLSTSSETAPPFYDPEHGGGISA